jgi:uncharacterized membrane protein YhaH (DUF805 family)
VGSPRTIRQGEIGMDIVNVLFKPSGRINRQPYWIATLIVVGISIVSGIIDEFAKPVALLLSLLTWWIYIVLYIKRLHDIGRSGWWQLVMWLGSLVLIIVGAVMLFPAFMSLAEGGGAGDPTEVMRALTSSGGAIALLLVGVLLGFVFHIWLGCVPGQKGANKYGLDPLNPVDTEVFE